VWQAPHVFVILSCSSIHGFSLKNRSICGLLTTYLPHLKFESVLICPTSISCKIAILIFLCYFFHQQTISGPPQLPQQTVKTFTPANPQGLKNPGQYQQPNSLGSQLYTVSKLGA
jgi:hypothetical protein